MNFIFGFMWLGGRWRTRLPAIRTIVVQPIEIAITNPEYLYQRISGKVDELSRLGMNWSQIGRALKVNLKVIKDARVWNDQKNGFFK